MEELKQIVVYDVMTKKPIAVFVGYAACSKIMFPYESKQQFTKKIRYAAMNNSRLQCYDKPIAIRFASEKIIKLLGTLEYRFLEDKDLLDS
jgi:predicted protein tyrosine phosphatase